MRRCQSRSAYRSLLDPSFGVGEDLAAVTGALSAGEMARSDFSKLRRMLPYQNLLYLRWLFDRVKDGTAKGLGMLQERRALV
jgi:hypothetical protein